MSATLGDSHQRHLRPRGSTAPLVRRSAHGSVAVRAHRSAAAGQDPGFRLLDFLRPSDGAGAVGQRAACPRSVCDRAAAYSLLVRGIEADVLPVSTSTENKLRDAMRRLLAGNATKTDGRLIKANLHVEAGVSRATMNRAAAVMGEWDAAVRIDVRSRDPRDVEFEDAMSELRHSIAKLRLTNTETKTQEPSCGHRDRRAQCPTVGSTRCSARRAQSL
jgi:hypothetical protein